jgi:FixJ family two-component response regulator
MATQEPAPTVYLVDDDPDLLKALQRLLQSAGLQSATFGSAQAFLQGHDRHAPGCLVLDLSMPGLNGLQLQRELERLGSPLPIVFLSGRGDIAATVQAMKHGATDFLTKPVDDTELLAAIQEALATDRQRRAPDERARIAGCLADSPNASARCRAVAAGHEQADRCRTRHGRETVKFHRGN